MGGDEKEEAETEAPQVQRRRRELVLISHRLIFALCTPIQIMRPPSAIGVWAKAILFYEFGQGVIQENCHRFARLSADPMQTTDPTAVYPGLI